MGDAVAYRFHVTIDGLDLGDWTKCDGLSIEYELLEHMEGGNNAFVHRLPGRAKYTNVRLTRPLNGDSSSVASWMSSLMVGVMRQTAEITVLDAAGQEVEQWNLVGVIPVKWTGPTLDVNGNQAATETVELAHHGFLGMGGAGAVGAGALTGAGGLT